MVPRNSADRDNWVWPAPTIGTTSSTTHPQFQFVHCEDKENRKLFDMVSIEPSTIGQKLHGAQLTFACKYEWCLWSPRRMDSQRRIPFHQHIRPTASTRRPSAYFHANPTAKCLCCRCCTIPIDYSRNFRRWFSSVDVGRDSDWCEPPLEELRHLRYLRGEYRNKNSWNELLAMQIGRPFVASQNRLHLLLSSIFIDLSISIFKWHKEINMDIWTHLSFANAISIQLCGSRLSFCTNVFLCDTLCNWFSCAIHLA